ncbi:alpha/beta hydrolase [Cognaticolwellia mytili]|uniref:alpha/beta hydrolase n=1 Tax=Cognaticolwellia mytili TaxID=1888913 RepID=UPI000A16E7E4|nr:alpha/beta hydrolase [Cognaticolwellia mytili]
MVQQSIEQLSLEQLNKEYSPSSCIEDINVYIQQYVEQSRVAKDKAFALEKLHSNQYYGQGEAQRLDLYLPYEQAKRRLMVYIHGGYWQELSKEESSFAATNFQQQGFHFAVLDYTLAPDVSISEIVEESRQAITWLHQNAARFGYDPEQIYLCGSSAGAHLAMMMLQTQWSKYIADYQSFAVKGVCAVSGIYDLQPLLPTYVNDALKMDRQEAKNNSPALRPLCSLANTVPVIIAFGDIETSEFKRQSEIMAEKLTAHGVDVRFKEIVERNHFDVILDLGDKSTWLSQQAIAMMS